MKRIMFVCHGNICRSPMVEFVMRKMINEHHLSHQIDVDSCATSNEEIGNSIYPPVRKLLVKYGIDCSGKKAQQLKKAFYDDYDYFIAMEDYNISNIMRIFKTDPNNKVFKLLDRNVADPWYTNNFQKTWDDINEGCTLLLNQLKKDDLLQIISDC